jgi:hypothetical protein
VLDTIIVKIIIWGFPLCSLIEENIKENSNVCLLPNADKDDKPENLSKAEKEAKDEIVRPLNIDCVEAINHVISAKMLYNKLGTNQNNTYPDFLNVNMIGVYNGAIHDNNEEYNPYNNYNYKQGRGFVSLGKSTRPIPRSKGYVYRF